MSPIVSTIHQSRPGRAVRSSASIFDTFTPNLPSGLTLLGETSFGNLLTGTNVNADGFAVANNDPADVQWANGTDANAPFGPNVLDIHYTPNSAPNGAATVQLYMVGRPTVLRYYWALAVYFSPNYLWHQQTEKFFYPNISTPGQPNNATSINISLIDEQGSNTDPFSPFTRFTFGSQVSGTGVNIRPPVVPNAVVTKGRWHLVEMEGRMNTPGNQDGLWRVWVDGNEAVNNNAVRYTNYPGAEQSVFTGGLRFTTTRGGGPPSLPVPPEGMFRRFSRLAVYGSTTF